MKAIVFAYHNMGLIGIEKLRAHGFSIPLVFTHADNPDENVWFGSVRELCRKMGIEAVTPESPNTPPWIERIRELAPDYIFSFYYRHMIDQAILSIPPLGAYNLHGSLLPKYRGRCPVNWVIIKGEETTGVTLHEMVVKPDAGAIVAQRAVPITPDDTALSLFHKLESAAGALLDACLPEMADGLVRKTPMDLSQGSYYGGRKPEDGRIDWHAPARDINNLIRGVTRPYPGAYGLLGQKKLLIWAAAVDDHPSVPAGKIAIHGDKALIGTGRGCLRPLEIELDGCIMKDADLFTFFKNKEGDEVQ